MASNIQVILDTSKKNYIIKECNQNDNLHLEAEILENGKAKDLTNCTILIQALKSDNTFIIQDSNITKAGNKVQADLLQDFTRVGGKTKVEIVLKQAGKQNTTFDFELSIRTSVIDKAVESTNKATVLENLQGAITEGRDTITQITQTKESSIQAMQSTKTTVENNIATTKSQAETSINNLKTQAVNTITTTKSQAETSITTIKTQAETGLTTLKTELQVLKNELLDLVSRGQTMGNLKNYAVFGADSVIKGGELDSYNGNLIMGQETNAKALINQFMTVEPRCKYDVFCYDADEIYIWQFIDDNFVSVTRLTEYYRWVYGYTGNVILSEPTTSYLTPGSFSYFTTDYGVNKIKVSFVFSDYSTNPSYFPYSNSLALDNAINSLKIIKVSEGVV